MRKKHTPVHVFNTHKEPSPDFFWADAAHLVSCSKDSTVQLHSVEASHQPLKWLRTVACAWGCRPDRTTEVGHAGFGGGGLDPRARSQGCILDVRTPATWEACLSETC